MSSHEIHPGWGEPPWNIDFTPPAQPAPPEADFAVVGGGFTGLAAAAWLRHLAPNKSVVILEAGRIGAGASGRTGGIALAETAAGDLPGLGDVLKGFCEILAELRVECDLSLPGAWEIGRADGIANSKIDWQDSGRLRVVKEVPGGTLDPGKLVSELARAASGLGAAVIENCAVESIEWGARPALRLRQGGTGRPGQMRAEKILLATNALSPGLAGLAEGMHPRLTLATLTEPLTQEQLKGTGLAERKPFYTVDLPYLWGRVMANNSVILGAGLVSAEDARDLDGVRVDAEEPAEMFATLENRVRSLHPALAGVKFIRRWGGPILFRDAWTPVFDWHPEVRGRWRNAIVLAAFAGHGVALTSYLARWAVESLVSGRELPAWGKISG
jgi:glycine/D-amino acid oxidase-like deaminating enzyme